MNKIFGKIDVRRSLLSILIIFILIPVCKSEPGEKNIDPIINKKLEDYKNNYPKFDYNTARSEAEKEYQKAEINSKVSFVQLLNGVSIDISGTYYGKRGNMVLVGGKEVPLYGILENQRHLFDEELRQDKISAYITDKLKKFNKKKHDDIDEFKEQLVNGKPIQASKGNNKNISKTEIIKIIEDKASNTEALYGVLLKGGTGTRRKDRHHSFRRKPRE